LYLSFWEAFKKKKEEGTKVDLKETNKTWKEVSQTLEEGKQESKKKR